MTTPGPQDPYGPPPGWGQPPSGQQPGQQSGQQYGQPYGQPYGQQPGYGPPPPGWSPAGPPPPGWDGAPQTESKAIAVLVLGIASFLVLPVIPAVVALALAPAARRTIRESGGRLTGEGLVTGGVVAAWVNIGLAVLAMLIVFLVLVFFASAATG